MRAGTAGVCLVTFLVLRCLPVLSQDVTFLDDINRNSALPSIYGSLGELNGKLLFSVNDGVHGEEVWVSQSLTAQPQLLLDLVPGPTSSNPKEFTSFNNQLYFAATGSSGQSELWQTDGTAPGTVKVTLPFQDGVIVSLTVAGGKLFFKRLIENQQQLYVTDGTEPGSVLLMDFPNHPGQFYPDPMIAYNGSVFLRGAHPTLGLTLWKSDGTIAGTVPVKTTSAPQVPQGFYLFNNKLYFSTTIPFRIWQTDGTPTGTQPLSNMDLFMVDATVHRNMLFFSTQIGSIWKLFTINRDGLLDSVFSATQVRVLGGSKWGVLLNVRKTASDKSEIWLSNGTRAGTRFLTSLTYNGDTATPIYATTQGANTVIIGRIGSKGDHVWVTNGTAAGTHLVRVNTRTLVIRPLERKVQRIFCWTWEIGGAYRLDYFSGTLSGNGSVPIPLTTDGSSPQFHYAIGDEVLFTAYTPNTGYELWKTSAASFSSVLVKDIRKGGLGSPIFHHTLLDSIMYFGAEDSLGYEPWRTDGTTAGTVRIKDIIAGSANSFPRHFFTMKGAVYFWARDTDNFDKVWTTDGSENGTHPVLTDPGPSGESFVVYGSSAYWFGNVGGQAHLKRFDGNSISTLGTFASVEQDFRGNEPAIFRSAGGSIYFAGDPDGSSGIELWKIDTASQTVSRVKDIHPGGPSSMPSAMIEMNGLLYFGADDGVHGRELWVSDGTEAGTQMVKDINPGLPGCDMGGVAVLDNVLYFGAEDADHGFELWKTQGNAVSTALVLDIVPGTEGGNPISLKSLRGHLFFKVPTSELWIMEPSGLPQRAAFNDRFQRNFMSWNLFEFGDLILFGGVTPGEGEELWAIDFRQGQVVSPLVVSDKHVNDPDFRLTATASSGLPVVFQSSDTGIIAMEGDTARIIGGGTVTLSALQRGNAYWKPASAETTIQVIKSDQTITVTQPPDSILYVPAIRVQAESSSGLPVYLELAETNIGEYDDDTLRLNAAGDLVIIATQDGDERFNPAPPVEKNLHIGKLHQLISFTPPDTVSELASLIPLVASSDSGLPLAYAANTANIVLASSGFSTTLPGKARITASQPGSAIYHPAVDVMVEFCVAPLKPILTRLPSSTVLQSSRTEGNYWYVNGTLVPEETGSSIDLNLYIDSEVRVRVIVEGCESPKSDLYYFSGDEVTGLETEIPLTIYPNPVDDVVYLNTDQPGLYDLALFDAMGRELSVERIHPGALDVKSLPKGFYLLRLRSGGQSIILKFMKD